MDGILENEKINDYRQFRHMDGILENEKTNDYGKEKLCQ